MANRTIHNEQLLGFIKKIEQNLVNFNFYDPNSTRDDKINYIRYQRELFDVAGRVLDGSIYFVGTTQELREEKTDNIVLEDDDEVTEIDK